MGVSSADDDDDDGVVLGCSETRTLTPSIAIGGVSILGAGAAVVIMPMMESMNRRVVDGRAIWLGLAGWDLQVW